MGDDDLTCRLVFGESDPALVISFNQFALTLPEISELASVLGKTATKWLACRKCGVETCNQEVRDGRSTGAARNLKIIH